MTNKFHNNIGYWCSEAVANQPESVAIFDLCQEAPRAVSYAELDQRMNRFAAMLCQEGLRPGDRLAMVVGNRFEFVEVMFGAMRAGIVPVPLNTKLGAEALDYIIRDADCIAAVVEPDCNSFVEGVVERSPITLRYSFAPLSQAWQHYEDALMAAPAEFDPPRLGKDHPSFQPYTSGSTGRPKGVILTHEGQLWWIRACQKYWPEGKDERTLAAVPLYHKNAMAGAIKPMLLCGGSVVLLPNFEPRRFLNVLSEYKCTQAGAVPAVFTLLLQHRDLIDTLDFSSLKSFSIGSAPVAGELMTAVKETFGVSVSESYGLTEGGPVMIGSPIDGRPVPVGSCGVAWPEGEIKLVDSDGKQVPDQGELWVRNPGVTPGYHNLPEVNAKRLRDGWLATGDLFRVDEEGFYYFLGRTDDMFNSGGENIYPKEVENLLIAHPAVQDVCVVPLEHSIKGHVPVALVTAAQGQTTNEDELKQYCLANGPAYAHPRRIMITAELPLNGAGKIDRQQVSTLLQSEFALVSAERN
jgi:acyl-CoA synthetase (AMP-forming)/AMP-acid ligase II